jgi:hypothetical protein
MWDPDDSARPDFLGVIEMLEPLALAYQEEEERIMNGAKCCVVS